MRRSIVLSLPPQFVFPARAQCYKTFYVRKFRIFVISLSSFSLVLPVYCFWVGLAAPKAYNLKGASLR
jgi:hypothetical protein